MTNMPLRANQLNEQGLRYQKEGDQEAALSCFYKGLKEVKDPKLYNNAAVSHQHRKEFAEALECYINAIKLCPLDLPYLYMNLGGVLQMMNKVELSIMVFRMGLRRTGQLNLATGLVPAARSVFEWHDLPALDQVVIDQTRREIREQKHTSVSVFTFQCMPASSAPMAFRKQVAIDTARRYERHVQPFAFTRQALKHIPHKKGEKIKVAYMSPDFKAHSLGHSLSAITEHHNRDDFEWYGIALDTSSRDQMLKFFISQFKETWDVGTSSYGKTAQFIAERGINIIVDLTGHTKGTQFEILALKPAPIQCHYLGFSTTTGASYIDYLISDRNQYDDREDNYCSEKLVRLPDSFIGAEKHTPHLNKTTREQWGLPEKGFIYASFCAPYKQHPDMLRAWIAIIKHVPDSVLWLYSPSLQMDKNIMEMIYELETGSMGSSEYNGRSLGHNRGGRDRPSNPSLLEERIIFARPVQWKHHLSRLHHVDLLLDTLYHGGGVTTTDALIQGVPVITIRGETPPARNGASLLSGAGLGQYVVGTLADYQRLAVSAVDIHPMMKEDVQKALQNGALFKPERLAAHLEWAYKEMVNRWMNNKPMRKIDVPQLFEEQNGP